jgi:dTDP-4-amino-4,6-dideoxygalactose transaminase
MTELQAALGASQMKRLDEYVAKRHQLANQYNEHLADLPITLPWQHTDSYSGFHLYVVRINTRQLNKTHRQVFEALSANGIGVNLHYIPVHTQPYYQLMGFKYGDYPESERYYSESISLPMFQSLSRPQQDNVISALKNVLTE